VSGARKKSQSFVSLLDVTSGPYYAVAIIWVMMFTLETSPEMEQE
jgi:hypothetical protein